MKNESEVRAGKIRYKEKGVNSDLHQVPAVDVSILGTAHHVGVFTGQTAVQLVALHLVARVPGTTGKTGRGFRYRPLRSR